MDLYNATAATTLLSRLQVYGGNNAMVKYFLKSEAWKTATPQQLAGVLQFLSAKDPISAQARAKVRQHLQTTYLGGHRQDSRHLHQDLGPAPGAL